MVKTFLFCDTMKRISVTIFIFGFIGICRSQKCSSPNITNHQIDVGYDFEKELSLTYSGVIRSFQMIGTVRIVGTSNNNFEMKYIDASYNSATGSLDLYTTENFPKYIEEQTSVIIYITVKLRCQDSSEPSLLFRLNLEQANLYDPKFPEDLYSFTVPLPLYKGFDLTTFQDIFARDIDLTGNAVTFTSSDSGIINVVTSSRIGSDQKTFYASLILTAPLLRITDALNLTITATDSGTPPRQSIARVSISGNETVTLAPQPRFENIVYEGKLDEKYSLSIENAVLVAETWSNAVKFTTEGQDRSFFTTTVLNNAVIIRLARPIREQDIKDKSFLSFTIVASKPDVPDGRCAVVVSIPQKSSDTPQFEQALYGGKINNQGNLELDEIVLINATYTDGTEFQLQGDASDHFALNTEKNIIKIRLVKSIPALILRAEDYLVLILVARNPDGDSGSTSILLDLPSLRGPEFSETLYKGSLDRYFKLSVGAISISPNTYEEGIEISLSGGDSQYFKVKLDKMDILLDTIDNFESGQLDGRSVLEFKILAKNKGGLAGSAFVVIEVSNICAQGTCPPCMAPTSEPCSEVTTPKPTGVPVFDRQFYSYRVDPGFIGVLSAVTAKIQDSNDGIRYSLEVTSAHLEPRLSIDQSTGQLTIHDSVSPGLYAFKLLATNSVTNSQGSAIARLTVDAVTICPNGTMVSSSLLIKPIAEEAIHTDLLYTRYGRCMLTVFSMEPNDKEYVQINSRTNQLFTIAIDREDKIFSDMLVPQIQVKLKLNCPGMDDTTERFRRSLSDGSSAFGDRSLVLTDDIPFNPYVTILSLVIEDINDNSPEFKNPPRSDFVIGYPEIEVLFDLMPEFLIQVAATDKDAGLNAQIRYGIIANDFFEIDPISGIVYPLAASKNRADDFELIVTACDRDGASDGRKAAIKIIVKTILSRHLSLLTVENQNIQDLDNLLSSISMRTKMDIYNLRHAMMPDRKVQNKDGILNRSYTRFKNLLIRQSEHRMILKTWIYAIDEKNDFVDNTDVEKKLSEINDEFDLVTVPYYSERQSSEKFEKVDTSGLITGISLLGSIIILAIVGGLVYWWFWLRPYRFKTGLNETTSETISSESTMDHEIKYKNSSNIYYENDDDFVASQYKKRESMPISGTTHLETSDESNGSSYDSYNDSDNSRGQNERRKSMVTFNELVERIDIEIGHNNFRRNNDDDARL